jgi:hypothetical protein
MTEDLNAEELPGEDEAEQPVPMTRRERRAAARGGPAQKIAGPAGGSMPPPPVRHRNYSARKGG